MEQQAQTKISQAISQHLKHSNIKLLVSALLALLLFFIVKRFVLDIAKVNNDDMMSTYSYGDALLVKRTSSHYAYGDVVYFEYPRQEGDSSLTETCLFQRIVGTPGDTFSIVDKCVFINGVKMPEDSTFRFNYLVKTRQVKPDSLFRQQYRLEEGGEISSEFDYSYSLTRRESRLLQKDPAVESVSLKTEKSNTYDESCFPASLHYAWNSDHYGKLYLPRENDTLRLDTVNIHLYKQLISNYEKNRLEIRHDSIFIDDQLTTTYVVKKDYYFVMGDNRDNANDSRNWGLLPCNLIKGKAIARLRKGRP